MQVGDMVRIIDADRGGFSKCLWWPTGQVTGTVQKIFKNGQVAVAIHQLRNVNDSGDGLRTLHFRLSDLEVIHTNQSHITFDEYGSTDTAYECAACDGVVEVVR